MAESEFEIYIRPEKPLPDFRQVIAFLWHAGQSVDSEGDSYNPASHSWTHLYLQNRESEDEVVEVWPEEESPIVLSVSSPQVPIAARVAYFLSIVTEANIAFELSGPYCDREVLKPLLGEDFDVEAAFERAK